MEERWQCAHGNVCDCWSARSSRPRASLLPGRTSLGRTKEWPPSADDIVALSLVDSHAEAASTAPPGVVAETHRSPRNLPIARAPFDSFCLFTPQTQNRLSRRIETLVRIVGRRANLQRTRRGRDGANFSSKECLFWQRKLVLPSSLLISWLADQSPASDPPRHISSRALQWPLTLVQHERRLSPVLEMIDQRTLPWHDSKKYNRKLDVLALASVSWRIWMSPNKSKWGGGGISGSRHQESRKPKVKQGEG